LKKQNIQFWFWDSLWVTSNLGVFLLWLPGPARQSKKQFFGSSFLFGIWDNIRGFSALGWIYSTFGAGIMAQKPQIGKSYALTNASPGCF